MPYIIVHKENDDLYYDLEDQEWSEDVIEYDKKYKGKPTLGEWLKVDEHIGCTNWPNCNSEGCGY